MALVQNPLDIGQVDSANAYRPNPQAMLDHVIENFLGSRSAIDFFRVGFPANC